MYKWETVNGTYTSHDAVKLGKYIVGGVSYYALGPRGSKEKWQARCHLPGIRSDLGRFKTKEDAIAQVEKAITVWINGTGLSPEADISS